ncbi:hypothetical protein O1611_g9312 [Lasiodiplodia mahajangana]|uniref:Uncharacterized protein n=1 Tax=Lasiodiplodia mahajangana TaxID=1108764 RepID=A0ACC2JAD1_9PEZI|nr:hypothetical protein O1611_g9312 [Lasiodiplodia mahajangana]
MDFTWGIEDALATTGEFWTSFDPLLNGPCVGCEVYLSVATHAQPNYFEEVGTNRLVTEYHALPVERDTWGKHETDHKSEELLRIGEMLIIIKERKIHRPSGLNRVMSGWWDAVMNDEGVISRAHHKVSEVRRFATHLRLARLQDFANEATAITTGNFMDRLERAKDDPRLDLPILPVSDIQAILYAEIWCTYVGNQYQMAPPSIVEFLKVFKLGRAEVTGFLVPLATAFQLQYVYTYCLAWYGSDLAMVREFSTLKILIEEAMRRSPVFKPDLVFLIPNHGCLRVGTRDTLEGDVLGGSDGNSANAGEESYRASGAAYEDNGTRYHYKMPLISDITIDYSRFNPENASEDSKNYSALLEKMTTEQQKWWEVGPTRFREMMTNGEIGGLKPGVL